MNENDGGPALPRPVSEYTDMWGDKQLGSGSVGMSLRDWFAGQAIKGHMHADESMRVGYARQAYAMADAMLAERSKP